MFYYFCATWIKMLSKLIRLDQNKQEVKIQMIFSVIFTKKVIFSKQSSEDQKLVSHPAI